MDLSVAIPFNGRNDNHAGIGKGYIAESYLKAIVQKCTELDIPMILETPSEGMQAELSSFKALKY